MLVTMVTTCATVMVSLNEGKQVLKQTGAVTQTKGLKITGTPTLPPACAPAESNSKTALPCVRVQNVVNE